jgi:RND family efflux transporter MFP subunit
MNRLGRLATSTVLMTALAAGTMLMSGAIVPAFGEEAAKPALAKPPTITVAPAARGEIVETETVVGSLVPREEILVGVDLDGYRLTELDAEEGDRVKKGQILARLSTDTLQILLAQNAASLARNDAAIAQAKSQIAEASATEIEARSSLDRGNSLKSKGFVADNVIDQRRSLADAASARRAAAEQGLAVAEADKTLTSAVRRELELRLAKTDIKAPTDGVVLSRNARIGAVVSGSGEPMFRIAEDGAIELEAQVPETSLAKMAVGQPVMITAASSNGAVRGTIRLVSPKIDSVTRLGRIRIALPQGVAFNSGAFARGTVEIARHDGVTLPVSAIVTLSGKATAQVVVDGKVETRAIETGISGNGFTEIKSGVKEGEMVILRAGTFVRDGDMVTPVAAPDAAVLADSQGAKG